jgi:hypothetical protein
LITRLGAKGLVQKVLKPKNKKLLLMFLKNPKIKEILMESKYIRRYVRSFSGSTHVKPLSFAFKSKKKLAAKPKKCAKLPKVLSYKAI